MFFVSKYAPKQEVPPQTPAIEQKVILQKEEMPLSEPETLSEATIGNFVVNYSSRGGYVKNIFLKDYQTQLFSEDVGLSQEDKNVDYKANVESDRLVFSANGKKQKEFIFKGKVLTIKLSSPSSSSMIIFSNNLKPKKLESGNVHELFYYKGDNLQRLAPQKIKEETFEGVSFAGTRDNHFCLSLTKGSYNVKWQSINNRVFLLASPPVSEVSLYIGPCLETSLKSVGLEGIVNYGFFHSIGVGLAKLLYFFYSFSHNWGVSIIILAIITYAILFPFTMKSTKAMRRMQEIQPQVDALRKQYKDNPQKLNKETLELYKKNKVNPIGGCLPLLFQFPVFIALYQVLSKFVELKNSDFLWIKDLTIPDHAFKLPLPPPVDYLNVLPLLIVVVGFLQQKFANPVPGSADQKRMGLFMIGFMGIIFYNFPAGLTLYWLTQNILTFAYQLQITHAKISRENS
jgi:YidC/Oxa1 family membrane protein insertase